MSLINHRRRSARWHGASQKVGQSAAPLFLDQIDIQVEVQPVEFDAMSSTTDGESSASIRARVVKARDIQSRRFADNPEVHCNAQMTSAMLRKYCAIDSEGLAHLKEAMTQLNMSARAYDRILKVARTIADLDGSENIKPEHPAKPTTPRSLDQRNGEKKK